MMIRSYDHAKKWKEKHLVIVHGIEITGAITSCHQLIEKHTGFWAQYAIVVPPGAKPQNGEGAVLIYRHC